MSRTKIVRHKIWSQLEEVAKPDSRFHFDFNEFIPDFAGSSTATDRLLESDFGQANYLFVTPDNSLADTRRRLIEKSIPFVVATHNISRGFRYFGPDSVPLGQSQFGATLDGIEIFGRPIGLDELSSLGRPDALVTGASAISTDGIRFGKGHIFFDMEWGILSGLGLSDNATPIHCLVHDIQLVDDKLFPLPDDVIVDVILTPTRRLDVARKAPRPRGVRWESTDPLYLETIPPLQEMQQIYGITKSSSKNRRAI